MSSSSTALPLEAGRPVASNMSLSLRPSLSSGMPERKDFMRMAPMISECSTVPLEATRRLSFSTTSRKISFLRCLIPSDRHDTVLVSATGGRGATSSRFPSCVMYSLCARGGV